MDSLTHLALGACTGEIILGKKLGKKAMLYGALIANIPDVDTFEGLFVRGDEALMLHRGITHSIFFALLAGLLLGYIAKKMYPKIGFGHMTFFACFELLLHDLLDTCTSYGTGLLEPFSHQRFSVHLLYVVDPLFTLSLLVAAIVLVFKKNRSMNREKWAVCAIALSGFYMCLAVGAKLYVDNRTKASLSTPAPFNTLLWYCIIKTNGGYYTAYSSVFDKTPADYVYFAQNSFLLQKPQRYLIPFAGDYYTLSKKGGVVYFNVLRFGQIQGWQNKYAPFALSYPLNTSTDQNMIIQKGRLTGWNKQAIRKYLERITGQ